MKENNISNPWMVAKFFAKDEKEKRKVRTIDWCKRAKRWELVLQEVHWPDNLL